jgi:hypothetical protein
MDETQEKKPARPIIAVSVPQEMADWLERYDELHPNQKINRSKVFQDAVFNLMHPQLKKVSPQVVLMMFMNFIIAMAIIFVSLWMPIQIAGEDTTYLKYILIFLAMILTVVSLMTYRYEKVKTKRQ